MKRPTVHLICNAHLDPVWQWRWEEGCAEAISTFSTAVEILHENPDLIFNHNEVVLYRWVKQYDPKLFREIQKLVSGGRWSIAGGWYLQPDMNLPGTESLIRQISEGRKFFKKHFNARPLVAYNMDSFGHTGGLPQILVRSGYRMYIHLRPQHPDLELPSDLYRWRGVDGSEIAALRIAVGLYHTERDNIAQRIAEGTELALTLGRDVPVFWGIGDHGGGPTRSDLETIAEIKGRENRVDIIHSTTERLYEALKESILKSPVVAGDLQRVFTGCYTSISRIKRRSLESLGALVQAEALRAFSWWREGQEYPENELKRAWSNHLFNDFHDILSGSLTESAEKDALGLYETVLDATRRLTLGAAASFNEGEIIRTHVPITVLNTNPSCALVPIEVECMADLRPKSSGTWHMRLSTLDGESIPCQEEQPESLLPFNGWRRKFSFFASLPQCGIARFRADIAEGTPPAQAAVPALAHTVDPRTGLVTGIDAGGGRECLTGSLFQLYVFADTADSWGTDRWNYPDLLGKFEPVYEHPLTIADGPIRSVRETLYRYRRSRIILQTIAYANWKVLEFRFRIHWNETAKRLKLSIPTTFDTDSILCEVPGGAIKRPSDGQEHVHGRWLILEGPLNGQKTALAVVNSGQHGFDLIDGEVRLSVLRSAVYCHEQGFILGDRPYRRYMDQGVHDLRLLVTAGDAEDVRTSVAGLADWLNAPPAVYAHLPIGRKNTKEEKTSAELFTLAPANIRLLSCRQSSDEKALILRLHETVGFRSEAKMNFFGPDCAVRLSFKPYEIKTLRVERSGKWEEVDMIAET